MSYTKTQRELLAEFKKLKEPIKSTTPIVQDLGDIRDHEFDYMDATDFAGHYFKNAVNMKDIEHPVNEIPTLKPHGVPLFDDSIHSVTEFAMAIMAAARQKNLTDAAVNVFVDLFRIFLPKSNKVPSSYNKIKQIVSQNQISQSPVKKIIKCCGVCCKTLCECGKNQASMLVIYDLNVQFLSLFRSSLENLKLAEMLSQSLLMDIHQTEHYRAALNKYLNMLALSLYTDGGRYTENGAFEGWPLLAFPLDLPPKLRGKFTNIIFLAYWYSPEKPNWDYIFKEMDIRPFFTFENINYRLTFLQVIADIPAKQHLLNMLNVNGYNSCSDCDIKGENKNRTMTFPYAELKPRDPRTFMVKNKTIQGVKGLSVLRNYLELFPQGAIIDEMHSVYKGPMEDDLKKLINGFKFTETDTRLVKLDNVGKELIEKILSNTTFTKEYQRRRIRPLDMFANWKASELKLFMLYVIPSVFVYLSSSQLPRVQLLLDSMVKYMAAIRLLVSTKISSDMIAAASNIMKEWASQRALLWGDKAMIFKTHQALHLSEQVLQHGPLCTHSAFAGESAIGKIGKNISCYSMEVSVKQICERMAMEHASLTWILEHGQSDIKQMFKLDPVNPTRKTPQLSENNLTWKEFQTLALSNNLKIYWQHECIIYAPNDDTFTGFASLDDILGSLKYLEETEISFSANNNSPLLLPNAVNNFGKLLFTLKTLKKVCIYNVPEPFDIRNLYDFFMNASAAIVFKMYYCENIADEFKQNLHTFIENIIRFPPKVIPLVTYVGQDEAALTELEYLSYYWPEPEKKSILCCYWKCLNPFI